LVNIIPYLRNNISISLALSAIALLLLASPLIPLSNPLLQSAQAQTNLRFSTPIPANGTDSTQGNALTFDAQGETFISSERLEANGTYQITDSSSGQVLSSGSISRVQGCCLSNPSNGDKITILAGPGNTQILTSCSTSASNNIDILPGDLGYSGPVECSSSSSSSSQGGNSTAQPSSSSPVTGAATQQDSDGDGIPDSSDKCTHNSNPRCFKEGDTSSTTTQQEQPSSSNRTGNQTR
jgi:hypothetical protein